MTRDLDLDRVMEVWLSEGPTQMPRRFLDDTMDRIDRAPSRPFASRRTSSRSIHPTLPVAAAAAVVLVLAGIGLTILSGLPAVGTDPSPSPSVLRSHELLWKWTSIGDRPMPGIPASATTEMTFTATTLSIDAFKGPLNSAWSLVAPDNHLVLRLLGNQQELTDTHVDCQPAQEASYTVSLSPDGTIMTLASLGDLCLARAAVLAGDWARWPCPNPDSTCQPELTPGRHVSPFVPDVPDQSLLPTFLTEFSFEVPPGWSLIDTTTLGRPNDPFSASIHLLPDVAAHSQASNCPDAIEPGVDSTPAALAQWLTGLPGLVTTTPTPIEIGGFKGLMLDLTVAPTWTIPCQDMFSGTARTYADPVPAVFTFAEPEPVAPGGAGYIREYILEDDHHRYILLDVGSGHNLFIDVRAPDETSWDEFIRAAMPIVDSFEFVR